jgi:TonB family protein
LLAAVLLAVACARPAEPDRKPERIAPAAAPTDAAPPAPADADLDAGSTSLNARKWRYAVFFNRLRRAVYQSWSPTPAMLDGPVAPGPGGVNTVVVIRLTPAGEVVDVTIKQSSGHPALDAEGQRAVRAAGPFPDPPPGLVDATGAISFAFTLHYQR